MSPQHSLRIAKLADALEAAMASDPHASFAEAIEAMALICARRADAERIGTINEASWTNACTHLFDLAQAGRLYADPRP
jgi:hypothetical protein